MTITLPGQLPVPVDSPPTALPVAGHDPPVAWRRRWGGVGVVVTPAIGVDNVLLGNIPANLAILDSEPGQRP
ncbi:MAG TPA: hypothetical protein VGK41_05590 [Solirubrobacterales bacterium]